MGTNRRAGNLNRCKRCLINKNLCICEHLIAQTIQTPIQIIMHYKEALLTSNTSNLLKVIHNNCHIHHHGVKGQSLNLKAILKIETHEPLFLFPDDNAIELTKEFLNTLQRPINLIVPDGSWNQAKKFKRRIEQLSKIQSITLPKGGKSQYILRRANQKERLSTFEAVARSIGIIENQDLQESLEKIFHIFVQRVSMTRRGVQNL